MLLERELLREDNYRYLKPYFEVGLLFLRVPCSTRGVKPPPQVSRDQAFELLQNKEVTRAEMIGYPKVFHSQWLGVKNTVHCSV